LNGADRVAVVAARCA
jgi:ribonuclease/clavin/mitogillin